LLLNKGYTLDELLPVFKRPDVIGNFVLKPMLGFEERSKRGKRLLLVVAFSLVFICGFIVLNLNQSKSVAVQSIQIQKPKKQVECKQVVLVGADLPRTVKPHSNLVIAGSEFRVLNVAAFGGLTQLQLRRNCDSKRITVAAWKTDDALRVSKVN
jgi:hypothetical protein